MKTLVAFLALASVSFAAVPKIETTLDQNLSYVRIDAADTDKAGWETIFSKSFLALDLRHVTGEPAALRLLAERLSEAPAGESSHRLVLISADTPALLTEAVSHNTPRQLTLAARQSAVTPDIAVAATPEEDDTAFAAAETGTSLEKLITSEIEKKRFDETTLAHDRNAVDPDDGPDLTEGTTGVELVSKAPAKPHDRVLERAVQVHEGLTVLKR